MPEAIGFRPSLRSVALDRLTANVSALALPAGDPAILSQDANASGPWTIQGIVSGRLGEHFYIVNTGTNSFLLGHQNGGAVAVDRIISPTGADLTLAANQMARLWHDPDASRWRILEHTGT